jgi:hypothetical protein
MTTVKRLKYSEEVAHEVCEAIASSSCGLETICKQNPHFPKPSTIYQWLRKHKKFAEFYARAKQDQITVFIEDIIEISQNKSDDSFIDDMTKKRISNPSAVQRSRLEIDTKKWLASKLVPKIYGERYSVEQSTKELDAEALQRKRELDERFKKDY